MEARSPPAVRDSTGPFWSHSSCLWGLPAEGSGAAGTTGPLCMGLSSTPGGGKDYAHAGSGWDLGGEG